MSVRIGPFTISESDTGVIWIYKNGGEAMMVKEGSLTMVELIATLEAFFKRCI